MRYILHTNNVYEYIIRVYTCDCKDFIYNCVRKKVRIILHTCLNYFYSFLIKTCKKITFDLPTAKSDKKRNKKR